MWVKAGPEVKEVAHEGLVPFCVEQVFTIPSSSLDHASLGLSEPAESRIVSYLEYSPGRPVIVGVPGPRPAYFIILVSSSRKTSSLLTHHQPVFQVKAHKAPQQPPKIPVISWEGQQPSEDPGPDPCCRFEHTAAHCLLVCGIKNTRPLVVVGIVINNDMIDIISISGDLIKRVCLDGLSSTQQ